MLNILRRLLKKIKGLFNKQKMLPFGPKPPIHSNCRCFTVAPGELIPAGCPVTLWCDGTVTKTTTNSELILVNRQYARAMERGDVFAAKQWKTIITEYFGRKN